MLTQVFTALFPNYSNGNVSLSLFGLWGSANGQEDRYHAPSLSTWDLPAHLFCLYSIAFPLPVGYFMRLFHVSPFFPPVFLSFFLSFDHFNKKKWLNVRSCACIYQWRLVSD